MFYDPADDNIYLSILVCDMCIFQQGVAVNGTSGDIIQPLGFTTEAYKKVFSNSRIWIGYANTIFYVVAGTLIPQFLNIQQLGLYDTRLAILLPGAVSTFNLIIMRTAMASIDISLEESERLDGANHFTILSRIMVPLTKPTMAVLVLYPFLQKYFVKGMMVGSVKG